MALTMIKQITKHIIRSIKLKSVISNFIEKNLMTKSKHDYNTNLATYQINDISSNHNKQK